MMCYYLNVHFQGQEVNSMQLCLSGEFPRLLETMFHCDVGRRLTLVATHILLDPYSYNTGMLISP